MESIELDGVIVDIDYINIDGNSTIRIMLKSNSSTYKLIDPDFHPYFYLVPFDSSIDPDSIGNMDIRSNGERILIRSVRWFETSLRGRKTKALKIETSSTRAIPDLSEKLVEFGDRYEYDILFWKRYLIDKNISPLSGVHVSAMKDKEDLIIKDIKKSESASQETLTHLSFDIETYNPTIAPRPEKDPCIMISYATNGREGVLTTKEIDRGFVTLYKDERSMIEGFMEIIKDIDPDIIDGYNSSNFDIPYLMARSKKLGLHFDITRYGEEPREENHGLMERGLTLQGGEVGE